MASGSKWRLRTQILRAVRCVNVPIVLAFAFALATQGMSSAQVTLPPASAQPAADVSPVFTTPTDRDWLRAHRVIRVGAEINYAPYEFRDVRGRFTGVVADYLELIRSRLGADTGVRFEVVQLPDFDAVESRLQRREVDIVLALTPSRERAGYLAFTKPYLQYVNVIVTRDNHEFVTGLADFSGQRIAVVKGHSAQQLVARAYPSMKVTAYADILDALMAVSTGQQDGLVDDIFPVVHNIRQRQIGNLKLATPLEKSLQAHGFSIAVRSDWPEFVGMLDRLLDTITPVEQREISQKWLSVRYESKVDYRAIWSAAGVFSVLLTAAVFWIRQLRRQRAALEAARAQAEAANRAKDGFLAGMSHELRTPLHAILGYADLLRDHRVEGLARSDALATISDSGRHLLALINDLLDLSRIRTGHLELRPARVRLAAMIEEVGAMMRIEAIRKGLIFEVRADPGLPGAVLVDDRRLRQVLLNLLGNAVKFTERGKVVLSVAAASRPQNRTRLLIEVEDTGKGIDPVDRERIFAPFEQGEEGRRRESGVGLGLAISREIVERMGGNLTVGDGATGGSRFAVVVELPVLAVTAAVLADMPRVVGVAGAVRRVLVVDDQVENTRLIAQMLCPLGFDVRSASSGAMALEAMRDEVPDLALMDLRMPGMGGFASARALRDMTGGDRLPIVAASASVEDLSRAEADRALFAGTLRKPFECADLLAVLEDTLGLTWVRDAQGDVADQEGDLSPPPADRLQEILDYARLGKWIRVEQAAREMAAQGSQHAAFVGRLLAISRNFDEAQLARFVARHLGASVRPQAS